MKAVIFREFGPPSVLSLVTDQPKPVRKAGEVLVEVAATSVNPVDWKTRKGDVPRFMVKLPKVPGGDLAGTVIESESSKFPVGASVFACTTGFQLWSQEGAYAEFFSVPEQHLARAPANISMGEAAGLPLVSLTAWQALEAADLQPGQRLLVHAGAGGVGSMAIQLAKARGLSVTTTCSARNVEFCQGLGADRAIDYNTQRFEEVCAAEPFDGVIDLIGGSVEVRSLKVLKRSGTFVSVLNSGWIKEHGVALAGVYMLWQLAKGKALRLFRLGPKYTLLLVQPNGQQLEEVAKLVAAGAVKPVVDRVLPLSEAAAAHEYLEKGHARGKVILQVNPSEKSPGT